MGLKKLLNWGWGKQNCFERRLRGWGTIPGKSRGIEGEIQLSLRILSPWGDFIADLQRRECGKRKPLCLTGNFPVWEEVQGRFWYLTFDIELPLLCKFGKAFQKQLMEHRLIYRPNFWPEKAKTKSFSSSLSLLNGNPPTFPLFPLKTIAQVQL